LSAVQLCSEMNVAVLVWLGKLGQLRGTKPKMGQMSVPGELRFFLGHMIKNQDNPRKSSTDDHLSYTRRSTRHTIMGCDKLTGSQLT